MFELFYSLIAGAAIAATDVFSDAKNNKGFLTAIAFGAIVAVTSSQNPQAAEVLLGGTLGVMIAGKIDSKQHATAIICTAIGIGILGLAKANHAILVLFAAASLADEFLDAILEKKKMIITRPLMPITAIIASIATGNYAYIILIGLFDAGYIISKKVLTIPERTSNKKKRKIQKKQV